MTIDAVAHEVIPDDLDRNVGEPGAYYFLFRDEENSPCGMIHGCPCGCGGRSVIWFAGRGNGHQEWNVSGMWPKVTLSPSIGIKFDADGNRPASGFHWHGFLENGIFVER